MTTVTDIKKAYFQKLSTGKQILKIWYLGRVDEVNLGCQVTLSRARILYPEVIDHCLNIGFQDGTYPIDNRTEAELNKDYQEAITRAVNYETTLPESFEAWKKSQQLSF